LITVFHPDGSKLLNVDAPIGKLGLEEVRFVANNSGEYRIEIRPLSETESGRYEIKIEELRAARPVEEKQFAEVQALKKLNAERFRADAVHDKNALFRIYADEVLFVNPANHSSIGERRSILGAARQQPHSSIEQSMSIDEVKVLLAEDTAVLSSIVEVKWNVGGQKITLRSCYSDTYVKRSGRWQLLATHMTLVDQAQSKPQEISLDPELLDEYVGVYQLSSTIRLKVHRADNKLFVEGVGGTQHELVPESTDSFLIRGTATKHLFIRDSRGKVTHLVLRAIGQELKAAKLQ
jgi:hypothetical protein